MPSYTTPVRQPRDCSTHQTPRTSSSRLVASARALVLVALAACGTDSTLSPSATTTSAPQSVDAAESNDFWVPIAPMPSARSGLVAASAGGRVFAIGGADAAGRASATVEMFAPNRNRWERRAPLPEPRRNAAAVATTSGPIYVVGGFDTTGVATRTLYAYSAIDNSWLRRADLPVTSVSGIAGVIDGALFVLTPVASGGGPQLHRYDPSSDRWIPRATPPQRHARGVGGVIEGRLYVAGGDEGRFMTPALHVYDPATDSWRVGASMPKARTAVSGHAVKGKLYVIGGSATLDGRTPLATVEVYDARSNRWSVGAPMPGPRVGMATANLDGHLPTVGGFGVANTVLATNEVYIP